MLTAPALLHAQLPQHWMACLSIEHQLLHGSVEGAGAAVAAAEVATVVSGAFLTCGSHASQRKQRQQQQSKLCSSQARHSPMMHHVSVGMCFVMG
jgi:hypothetical protein